MDKRAEATDIEWDTVVGVVLVVLFFGGMFWFVAGQENGGRVWEDFYSKEISRVINLAEAGDEITLDVHDGTEVALKNDYRSYSSYFQFDNLENRVCVKFSGGGRSCYSYFNNVDVVNLDLEVAGGGSGERNVLSFRVVEKQRGVENG